MRENAFVNTAAKDRLILLPVNFYNTSVFVLTLKDITMLVLTIDKGLEHVSLVVDA